MTAFRLLFRRSDRGSGFPFLISQVNLYHGPDMGQAALATTASSVATVTGNL
jgi:hypothetical protein